MISRSLFLALAVGVAAAADARGQSLPSYAPLNAMSTSRSALYFQPYLAPAPGRWDMALTLDYASVIEYNRLPPADYILDSELLRLNLGVRRDLDLRTFFLLDVPVGGAYSGFLDGFLDWYHGTLGIRVVERERRPRDRFLYTVTLPDGSTVSRSKSALFLGDLRVGLGIRHNPGLQTVLSFTLPTSTGPEGYGRGVPAVALLNTLHEPLTPRLHYEGSLGLGYTPGHGEIREGQRELFLAATSGFRVRVGGRHSAFANLFYHSPYYQNTTLPALDQRELSLDFGWIIQTGGGGEWRLGLTEDLEPGGPGVDLVVRVGRTF